MHPSLVANRLAELFQKALHQFVAALRRRRDLVVPRDALRLVVTNTTADQVDLVAEVIVQHTVRKLGFLRDLAQASPRIAELSQGFQRSLGEFNSSCAEFVDASTFDSIPGRTRPAYRFSFQLRHSRLLAHAPVSESPRHLGAHHALKRPSKSSSTLPVKDFLDKCLNLDNCQDILGHLSSFWLHSWKPSARGGSAGGTDRRAKNSQREGHAMSEKTL